MGNMNESETTNPETVNATEQMPQALPTESLQSSAARTSGFDNPPVPSAAPSSTQTTPIEAVSTDPVSVPAPSTGVTDSDESESNSEEQAPTPALASSPLPSSSPIAIPKPQGYVHPLIEMVNKGVSEADMICMLESFCGRQQVGTRPDGQPIYEVVDQTDYIGPVLQVFSYCSTNSKGQVVEWLLSNFVPLQVSYDNNFCFFQCLQYSSRASDGSLMADLLVRHESFFPSLQVLENLMSRSRTDLVKVCMSSPYLRGDLSTYRFTIAAYVDANQPDKISTLLNLIKQRESGQDLPIPDEIYPNPRLVQAQAQVPVPESMPVSESAPAPESMPIPAVYPPTGGYDDEEPILGEQITTGTAVCHAGLCISPPAPQRVGEPEPALVMSSARAGSPWSRACPISTPITIPISISNSQALEGQDVDPETKAYVSIPSPTRTEEPAEF
ncbi:Hypothetical protein MVR_LOCUS261 [uncultured virus]|nr:Hypothetical protein MVR_LOCUS261 [uncultured virus]